MLSSDHIMSIYSGGWLLYFIASAPGEPGYDLILLCIPLIKPMSICGYENSACICEPSI